MYKIMLVAAKRDNITKNLYKYMTDENNEVYQTEDLQELDAKVEEILNTYAKSDFIIIKEMDYNIDADIYEGTIDDTNTGTDNKENTGDGTNDDVDSDVPDTEDIVEETETTEE